MRYFRKVIDLILILCLFLMLSYFKVSYTNWLESPEPRLINPYFLDFLLSSGNVLLYFVLSVLCFKEIVSVKIKLNLYTKIIITLILVIITYALNLYWVIPMNMSVFGVVASCRIYGPILLGVWLALLCGDTFDNIIK